MGQIIYQIVTGTPNFTASILPAAAPDQTLYALGVYSFDDLPDDTYVLTVTDSLGCVSINEVIVVTPTTTTTTTTEPPTTTTTTTEPTTTTTTTTEPATTTTTTTELLTTTTTTESPTTTTTSTTIEPTTTTTTTEYCCEMLNFDTNSPSSTTFDPVVGYVEADVSHWDLGDGNIEDTNSVSHTYADGSTKNVTMCLPVDCDVTLNTLNFSSDNIVGELDLSSFTKMGTAASIKVQSNSAMTSLILPTITEGAVSELYAGYCDITGTLDVSGIDNWNDGRISICGNPDMTGITFALVNTGTLREIAVCASGITSIDISDMNCYNVTNGVMLDFDTNPSLTSIIFPASYTGLVYSLNIAGCGFSGEIDLTALDRFAAAVSFAFEDNASLTTITFADPLDTYSTLGGITSTGTNLTGTLDLSMFDQGLSSSSMFWMYGNPLLTNILMPSGSGQFSNFYVFDCDLGYIDFTGLPDCTDKNSCSIRLYNNHMTTAEVNHILADIDSISSGGYTGRSISIGGSNACIDSSTGGYNGVAAKSSLEGKGFSVSVSGSCTTTTTTTTP